jgi:hypothetical protein
MKGDSIIGQPADYGVQGVPAPTNKPGYCYEGTEWKDFSGNFWMYDNTDLWVFNPFTLNWTWFGGSQDIPTSPIYGVQGVPSPSNYPGFRMFGAASWTDRNGNLWLFGAQSIGGLKNDLWKYNVATNLWTWIKGDSLNNLAPRFGTKGVSSPTSNPGGMYETNASWTDVFNNLWLFGGWGYDSLGNSGMWNTLWKYNIATNEWTWISGDNFLNAPAVYGVQGIPSVANKPSSRFVYSKWIINDDLWLFGGQTNSGKVNDLWKYNITSNEWTWMSGSNVVGNHGIYFGKCVPCSNCYPYSRNESRSCWKDADDNLWVFGGAQNSGSFNDLWVYNTTTNKWTWIFGDSIPSQSPPEYGSFQVASSTNNPGGKNGAVSWIDNAGNLWLFAGQNGPPYNDLWKYEISEICDGVSVNVNEDIANKSIKIYPNPAQSSITIESALINSHLQIFNSLGNSVYQTTLNSKHQFLNPHLPAGIYFVRVNDGEKVYTQKLVVE